MKSKNNKGYYIKEIVKGVIVAIVIAVIFGVFRYIWLIKEIQINIQALKRDTESLSSNLGCMNESLNALKLFVVSAHPDRNYVSIKSAGKLKKLTAGELGTLAAEMDKYPTAKAFSINAQKGNSQINDILIKHQIDQNDLLNYWRSVKIKKLNEDEKP